MNYFLNRLKTLTTIICLTLFFIAPVTYADDLEIYGISESGKQPVNILFIMDISGSMSWTPTHNSYFPPAPPGTSRYEIMLDTLKNVLHNKKDAPHIRAGISWFNYNSSGIRWPITQLSEDVHNIDSDIPPNQFKVHQILPHVLEQYAPEGSTALTDALLEAAYYFRGGPVSAGVGKPPLWQQGPANYEASAAGSSHWPSLRQTYTGTNTSYSPYHGTHAYTTVDNKGWLGANYNTPITDYCTANYIVLLSDGAPTVNTVRAKAEALLGKQCAELGEGSCSPELVKFLAENDQIAGLPNSKVKTYTIGFAINKAGEDFLKNVAEKGQGDYFYASNSSDLEVVFEQILDTVGGDNESFTSVSTSFKASTLSSSNRIFMNLFKPSLTRSWLGNTKGYFISPQGIMDVNGNLAIIPNGLENSGEFYSSAQSFWSSSPDGSDLLEGGANSNINQSRQIYTYADQTTKPKNSTLDLITKDNSNITNDHFDLDNTEEKDQLIDWLYATPMADPLHATPLMLQYQDQGQKKDILFTMTNMGLLHAIDTTHPQVYGDLSGGNEVFSFIPQTLLSKLKDHKLNLKTGAHLYGLDGSISYLHLDTNKDTIINNGEKAYLYFGMRRGGRNYYALDISNPTTPKLAWRIEGGQGHYSELGQTWSRMTPSFLEGDDDKQHPVLIFGGGYDSDQDTYNIRTEDDLGNAIYIVDAKPGLITGEQRFLKKITRANEPNFRYSIPSDLAVVDTNNNELADRIYFGDMGGQLWSFNIAKTSGGVTLLGYKISSIGGDRVLNLHRFYYPPAVAKFKDEAGFYMAIALGSGFRGHPLSTSSTDYFYMIKDRNISPKGYNRSLTVRKSDIYDITSNRIGSSDAGLSANIQRALAKKKAWKLKLEHLGEKSLSPALIFDSKIAFTTYTPAQATANVCDTVGGTGRVYIINLKDGTPSFNLEDPSSTEPLTKENRSQTTAGIGIPSEPVAYFPPNTGQVNIYVGKKKITSFDTLIKEINWKVIQ